MSSDTKTFLCSRKDVREAALHVSIVVIHPDMSVCCAFSQKSTPVFGLVVLWNAMQNLTKPSMKHEDDGVLSSVRCERTAATLDPLFAMHGSGCVQRELLPGPLLAR